MQKIILAYNFTPERLQALKLICMMLRTQLRAVKGKLRQVALKAMLTPTNCTWSGLQLLQELSQEHAYMHGKNAGK